MKKYLYCFRAGKPIFILLFVVIYFFVGARSSRPAIASETTVYLGPIEKTMETGEVKVYVPVGNGTIVKSTMGSTGTTSYLYSDHLGSTVMTTDELGNKIETNLYYPYGQITNYQFLITPPAVAFGNSRWRAGNQNQNSNFKTDKLYTGQRLDSSSDLYFYNARYYNPNIGNFISADKAQGPNRYGYVFNNPVRYNDPTGYDVNNPGGDGYSNSNSSLNTTNTSNIQGSETYNNTLGIQTPVTPDVDLYCMNHDCLNVAPKTIEEKIQPFVQLLYFPVMYLSGAGAVYEVVDTALCGLYFDKAMCLASGLSLGPTVKEPKTASFKSIALNEDQIIGRLDTSFIGSSADVFEAKIGNRNVAVKLFNSITDFANAEAIAKFQKQEIKYARLISDWRIGPEFVGPVKMGKRYGYAMDIIYGDIPFLVPGYINKQTYSDVRKMISTIQRNGYDIADFQYLIGSNGRATMMDPGGMCLKSDEMFLNLNNEMNFLREWESQAHK